VRGPDRYRNLAGDDRGPVLADATDGPADPRRETLKLFEAGSGPEPKWPPLVPAPAPQPSGELLNYLDPWRVARAMAIEGLNELAWAER
jgi:hypothetical protein